MSGNFPEASGDYVSDRPQRQKRETAPMRFRALLCAVTTAGLVLGTAAIAWAHVTLH